MRSQHSQLSIGWRSRVACQATRSSRALRFSAALTEYRYTACRFDMQKAAVRACRNAIEFNSLPAIRKLVCAVHAP